MACVSSRRCGRQEWIEAYREQEEVVMGKEEEEEAKGERGAVGYRIQ